MNNRTQNSMLIFGLGFSGAAIATSCGDNFAKIYGTTRSANNIDRIQNASANPIIFDGTVDSELSKAIASATHILVSIGPNEDGDPVLGACAELLANAPNLGWIGYLSTVGVYGNHDGQWVDEESPCYPVSKRSHQRLAAELAWQKFAAKQNLPLAIFRLSGIYGPGRNAFVNMEKGTARRLVKPEQVFNRIRREDIGQAVKLAATKKADGIFNISDDEPAPPQDVVTYAHELACKSPPPEIKFEDADLSPMARSFYGENKRVSNAKSKLVLGLDYCFPNYRTSLKQLWEDENWKQNC